MTSESVQSKEWHPAADLIDVVQNEEHTGFLFQTVSTLVFSDPSEYGKLRHW